MSSPLHLLLLPLVATIASLQSPCAAAPSFIETDSIVFPEDDDDTHGEDDYDHRLRECMARDVVSLHVPVGAGTKCQPLLKRGDDVCPEGSWLVLDVKAAASQPRPTLMPVCRQRRCEEKLYYWPPLRRCAEKNESESLCPPNSQLQTDYFGDGFCECDKKNTVMRKDTGGTCHTVFTRGPCGPGHVWLGSDRCEPDNCAQTSARFPAKLLVPWSDGRCYAVNETGPCKSGQLVLVNEWSLQPVCGDRLTTLHLTNPPCSGVDHGGTCKQPVTVNSQNYFYSQIASQVKNKRARKTDPK